MKQIKTYISEEEHKAITRLLDDDSSGMKTFSECLFSGSHYQEKPLHEYDDVFFPIFQRKLAEMLNKEAPKNIKLKIEIIMQRKDLEIEDLKPGGSIALTGLILSLIEEANDRPDEFQKSHLQGLAELIVLRNELLLAEWEFLDTTYRAFLEKNCRNLSLIPNK